VTSLYVATINIGAILSIEGKAPTYSAENPNRADADAFAQALRITHCYAAALSRLY
jgi:hypothetical protein